MNDKSNFGLQQSQYVDFNGFNGGLANIVITEMVIKHPWQ